MTEPLPIDKLRDDFHAALADGHVVVAAATGSGKSTRLPLWARERGPVLVVEPRRVACTALADYVAGLAGTGVGEQVGYAIRFDHRHSDDSDVVFATPGVALRWLSDGTASRFATVMLDEFHERRWDTDLLLALLKARGEHRLILTSATLAADRLARYLEAPLLESEGKNFPVDVSHSQTGSRDMPDRRNLEARVAGAVKQALNGDDGDILVFLPGRGEIQAARNALSGVHAELVTLHATVAKAEQRRALTPGDNRRVILATNVAETSLTIPGVTRVIDSGLERRTHQRNGRTVLTLAPISRANAEQRRGRAGRTAPGHCLRLWGEQAPLDDFTPPEVQREPLTEMMLAAAAVGAPLERLDFPDPLPEKSLAQARDSLRAMHAIDGEGRITGHGRALFSLPIDTLFAHLITAMPDDSSRGAMADLAAALSTRPAILRLPSGERQRRTLVEWQPVPCDATTLIMAVRDTPPEALRHDHRARREARRLATQIRQRLDLPGIPGEPDFDRDTLMRASLEAAPELAFVRREKRRHAMGNNYREVTIGDDTRLEEDAEAALVFDDHSVPGKRGTRQTFTFATCLAPVPLSLLVDTGLGEVEPGAVRLEDGRPVVVEERHYANRVIDRRETVPTGVTLRTALARLILANRLLRPAGERLIDDLRQWHLYVALGNDQGETPSPEAWLSERLATLGVETPDDMELIEPEDLVFPGIPDWERQRFDDRYPARLNIDTMQLDVHYEVDRKRITVERVGGNRKAQPQRWELPAWSGWRIRFRDGSKVVDIR
jgi:HrpA-like RNA helicase